MLRVEARSNVCFVCLTLVYPRRDGAHARRPPGDKQLREVLAQVRLSALLQRSSQASSNGSSAAATGLDCQADWAAMLSLGEQQRLAFGRYEVSPHSYNSISGSFY